MRKCPNDKEILKKVIYKGVAVEECPGCHGHFFDRDELNRAKDSQDPDLRWLDFELFDLKSEKGLETEKECPRCEVKMLSVDLKESGVVVNICPKCRGVWLDSHEFEKIISSLEKFVSGLSSQDLADVASEELAEIFTGPKGVTEEMKDFFAVSNLLEMRYASEHPLLEKILEVYYKYTPLR